MKNQNELQTETIFSPFLHEIERVIRTTNSQLEI